MPNSRAFACEFEVICRPCETCRNLRQYKTLFVTCTYGLWGLCIRSIWFHCFTTTVRIYCIIVLSNSSNFWVVLDFYLFSMSFSIRLRIWFCSDCLCVSLRNFVIWVGSSSLNVHSRGSTRGVVGLPNCYLMLKSTKTPMWSLCNKDSLTIYPIDLIAYWTDVVIHIWSIHVDPEYCVFDWIKLRWHILYIEWLLLQNNRSLKVLIVSLNQFIDSWSIIGWCWCILYLSRWLVLLYCLVCISC